MELSDLPNFVVLIGKNSSGKSNLLDAINLLFSELGTDPTGESIDANYEHLFPNHNIDPGVSLEVAATILLSSIEWKELLGSYVLPEKEITQGLYFSAHSSIDEGHFAWLLYDIHIGSIKVVKDGNVVRPELPIPNPPDSTSPSTTSLAEVIAATSRPESASQTAEPEEPLRPSNSDGSHAPADLHLLTENQNQTILSRLPDLLKRSFQVIHVSENSRDWPDKFLERPSIINADDTNALASLFQSQGNQRQSWGRISRQYEKLAPNEQRPVAFQSSLQMEEGEVAFPIGMTGEGSQALLYLIAKVERGSQVLAIEEPETHLHPALVKKTSRYLSRSTNQNKQIFVSTHSPFFLDELQLESTFVVKNEGGSTQISPMKTTEDRKELLTDIGMRPSDILFSDAILLVEGLADHVFLNKLNHKLALSLMEHHIKVIEASGKSRAHGKIQFWAEVGEDASIPLYLIFDKDASSECDLAIEKYPKLQQQSLLLSEGELEDYYPLPEFEKAANDLYGVVIKETTSESTNEPVPTKERREKLKKLLDKKMQQSGRGGNEWKPPVAEKVVNLLDPQKAEAAFAEILTFLRKMHREIGTQ